MAAGGLLSPFFLGPSPEHEMNMEKMGEADKSAPNKPWAAPLFIVLRSQARKEDTEISSLAFIDTTQDGIF